jgi:hypothetical protein
LIISPQAKVLGAPLGKQRLETPKKRQSRRKRPEAPGANALRVNKSPQLRVPTNVKQLLPGSFGHCAMAPLVVKGKTLSPKLESLKAN